MTPASRERVAGQLADDDQEQGPMPFHKKLCKECDNQFVALRADAVTCSPKCRKRYQRRCQEITRELEVREARQREQFEQLCKDAIKEGS